MQIEEQIITPKIQFTIISLKNKCQIQYSVYLFASDFWCIPVIIFLNQ